MFLSCCRSRTRTLKENETLNSRVRPGFGRIKRTCYGLRAIHEAVCLTAIKNSFVYLLLRQSVTVKKLSAPLYTDPLRSFHRFLLLQLLIQSSNLHQESSETVEPQIYCQCSVSGFLVIYVQIFNGNLQTSTPDYYGA